MKKIIIAQMAMGLVLLAVLSGCTRTTTSPLRIGINAWPGYEYLYLAKEKGFYERRGLDVHIVEFNSLVDARKSFERDEVDIIGTTVFEAVLARHNSNKNHQIVYVVDYSNGADVILAAEGIKSMKELRGKKVGVEAGSVCLYTLARGLELSGLSFADIEMVPLSQSSLASALSKKQADAVVSYPPFSLTAQREAKVNTVFSTKEIPREIVDIILASENTIKNRKADLRKVLEGFNEAVDYSLKSDTDGVAVMAKREKISKEEFLAALSDGVEMTSKLDQKKIFFDSGELQKVAKKSQEVLISTKQMSAATAHDKLEEIAHWAF